MNIKDDNKVQAGLETLREVLPSFYEQYISSTISSGVGDVKETFSSLKDNKLIPDEIKDGIIDENKVWVWKVK